MKILVTGAGGFVGTRLTEELLKLGHEIVALDTFWFGDYLGEHPSLQKIKTDVRNVDEVPMDGVESIIHLANIANDPTGDLNSKLTWEVNVLASKLLIEKAIQSGVRQFIYASSGSVYGVKDEPEVTEDLSLVPISDYNKTKMISERVLLSYQDQIQISIVRPATICGYSPRMRLDLSVNMLTMQAVNNGLITVFGGQQTRPNIHLDDMIRVYVHFLNNPEKTTGVFNAGFENLSIMEIAERIKRHTGAEIKVTESNDPRSYRLSSRRLLDTGFKPESTVENAIEQVMSLYKDGSLEDLEKYYNLKVMKQLDLY